MRAWANAGAALWSLAYGIGGVVWTAGGIGYPFGAEYDPSPQLSILGAAPRNVVAPAIVVLGFAGAGVALGMRRVQRAGPVATAFIGFGTVAAIGLALLIPDYRILVVIAYLPILLVTARSGCCRRPICWPC